MRIGIKAAVAAALIFTGAQVQANTALTSGNGLVRIGINDDGSLNAFTDDGLVGLGYNFSGQGGRTGFQDGLTPGCLCESWGVSASGIGGQVGRNTGNQNILVNGASGGAGSFTSNTELGGLLGLTISQTYSLAAQSTAGALFVNKVTITNNTGGKVADVRYARATDWDVPPTEFNEWSTFRGTGTTTSLLRSTDDGFANANPLDAVLNNGLAAQPDQDGSTFGDHGSLFVFGFGDLAKNASYSFNLYYGAAANEAGALGLLGQVSPQLYNLGQSTGPDGLRAVDNPTYFIAFSGVGGPAVISAVPEPATWAMMIGGFGLLGFAMRRWHRKSEDRFETEMRETYARL